MSAIWKFPVEFEDVAVVPMPQGARLLTIGEQQGELFVWALCDPDASLVPRRLAVVGTGHPRDDLQGAKHVGSALMYQARLVFHIFDLGEEAP